MKTSAKHHRPDTYQIITDAIIEAMENRKVIPWRKTWNCNYLAPMNYASKYEYRGINALLCALSPYSTPFFLTLKQIDKLGGKLPKGSKSIPIVFWKTYYKDAEGKSISEEQAKAEGFAEKAMFPKYYRVFNIEDTDLSYELPEQKVQGDIQPLVHCEKIIEQMPNKPKISLAKHHKPSYIPVLDKVRMPCIEQFENAEEYYLTAFHELVHATGHRSRLNRAEVMSAVKFASQDYSKEELVAEIGASMLGQIANINTDEVFDNSIAYLQGWVKALKDDKKMVLQAASRARRAVEYVLGG